MKKKKLLVLIVSSILLLLCLYCVLNEYIRIDNVEFRPRKFSQVKVDYNEEESECSPSFFNDSYSINIIEINVPRKILIKNLDTAGKELTFPVCIFSTISDLRALKYEDDEMQIHICEKKASDMGTALSGPIYFIDHSDYLVDYISPYKMEDLDTIIQRHEQEVAEAAKLTDKELDNSAYSVKNLNINLLDYIDFPIQAGEYEVWVTCNHLESNRKTVKIVIDSIR